MSFERGRESLSLEAPTTPKSAKSFKSVVDYDGPQTPPKVPSDAPVGAPSSDVRTRLDKVLQSDIGINTLLTRLKQSISSTKEFSSFLRERANLEEKHANGLKKLARGTHDLVRRPENRQGSFAQHYEEITRTQDRMADNGMEFAQNLHLMAEELQDLAASSERGRKQWKHTGLDAEQRTVEAEAAMEKAKAKYFSFADQYDRARTGERQTGKFGLKGPKSAAQQEEALLTKVQNADLEYSDRVQAARAQRNDLLTNSRPQAVRELQNHIRECDAGLVMQLQKFTLLNEKLLLHNGLSVSPLKSQSAGSRSLRDMAQSINNQQDFEDFVLSHTSNVGPTPADIKYEKHPALMPSSQPTFHSQRPSIGASSTPAMGNTPDRRDTGLSNFNTPNSQSGQTSGVTPSHGPTQPSIYASAPGHSSPPPQLPQIGALSMGGRTSLDSGRNNGTTPARSEFDTRNFSGPQQHRPGQASYSGPMSSPQYGSGPTQQHDPYNTGVGRGGPLGGNGPYTIGQTPTAQAPYNAHNRDTSFGQSNDVRPDGRGGLPQSRPSYDTTQSDARGTTPALPNYQAGQPDPRGGSSQPSYLPHQNNARGAYSQPMYQPNQSDSRITPTQQGYQSQQNSMRGLPSQNGSYRPTGSHPGPTNSVGGAPSMPTAKNATGRSSLPPLKPVFGVSLDDLFRRDGGAVPPIVYQCVQAVDLYGLDTEGIYRTSGSAQHITELRALFDHDSSQVDFRDPNAFFNDIAAVTTLLKHFLRDLKDPLLTSAQYNSFVQAGKIDDDIIRRDSLHAIINSLPDPNYATLRTLVLHLNRVSQHSAQNRMTASNLAIVFGPTLMIGQAHSQNGNVADSGYQARVVETILNNTYQIFDDDD